MDPVLWRLLRRAGRKRSPFEPSPERAKELRRLERAMGVSFKDKALLNEALAHRSYTEEHNLPPYRGGERLAFLGDALLTFIVNRMLFQRFPEADEGTLTRYRSVLVSKNVLSEAASRLSLPQYLLVSKGMERSKGRKSQHVLSTAFEALVAAVYLDRGLREAEGFVRRCLEPLFEEIEARGEWMDYKSQLQILAQRRYGEVPEYHLVAEEGPPHKRSFVVEVWVRGERLAGGRGRTKKEAEQEAARRALQLLGASGEGEE
ncbi:MAG TPA: ribonuclease III [Armatimonadetes bacterium]|nr:ribonuclease III [Armatimonadota bacterium]